MDNMTIEEFHTALKKQGVPREHLALKCPMCGTVQSLADLIKAGVEPRYAEVRLGRSCIGRFTGAGPYKKGTPPGKGCDWSLGGLFKIHNLEVELNGQDYPSFEIATPEEAQAHMKDNSK